GEIRHLDNQYLVVDKESTNGTFVNGERLPSGGSRALKNGDVIGFGNHGPTIAVTILAAAPSAPAFAGAPAAASAAIGASRTAAAQPKKRVSTGERVATAVRQQTRMLKIAMSLGVIALLAVAGGLYWMGHREAAESEAKLRAATAAYEETSKQ